MPGDKSTRNDAVLHDTKDKGWWCQHGAGLEKVFVQICRGRFDLDMAINPRKTHDQYAPDLLVSGHLADLKTQNTPFFLSKRYGYDPRRTVTFNRKDYERYVKHYPDIEIYYWVDWTQTDSKFGRVDYLSGIYRLPFPRVKELIEAGASEHTYQHRVGDQKNAKSSFLLRLEDFEALFETDTK